MIPRTAEADVPRGTSLSPHALRASSGALRCAAALAVAGVALVPVHAQQAPSTPMDFATAQQRLLDTSDAIEGMAANVRSKEAQQGATRTLYRPTVDIEARLLDYQKTFLLPLGTFASTAASYGIADPFKYVTRQTLVRPVATGSVPIYSGGEIAAARAAAKAQVTQTAAEREIASEQATLQLAQAYFGQQLAVRALIVRRQALEGLDAHLADARKLEQARFAARAQVLQAQVARDDADRDYHKAISDLATANAILAGLLRLPGGVQPTTPLFVLSGSAGRLEDFKAVALSAHPQLVRLRALGETADAGVRAQQARLRPSIYGFGQYDFNRDHSLLTNPDWAFGVGIKFQLFSGTGRRQAVEAARETVAQADAGLREARVQLEIGVTKAWNEAEATRERFALLRSAEASAAENLRLQSLAFREQQATSLDVVDAQLGVSRVAIQRAQAAYDYDVAIAQLLAASG